MRIFYFCYGHNVPRGGNKHTYRHVDILNGAGRWATVFHLEAGFSRLTWFPNDTRVLSRADFQATYRVGHDVVVLPEDLGPQIVDFPGRKVIFNKNIFYGAAALGRNGTVIDPYLDPDVEAVFAVSEHNAAYLRYAYPSAKVWCVHPEIDSLRFAYKPLVEKGRIIATNGKASSAVLALFHLLRARAAQGLNELGGFQWIFLERYSEQETSKILSEALVFVFLSSTEGFGRMPLEAMASGCFVVAHGVPPMREYLPEASSFDVGDLLNMAKSIERLAAGRRSVESQRIVDEGRRAALRFSLAAQRESVLDAWTAILENEPASGANRLSTDAVGRAGEGFQVIGHENGTSIYR